LQIHTAFAVRNDGPAHCRRVLHLQAGGLQQILEQVTQPWWLDFVPALQHPDRLEHGHQAHEARAGDAEFFLDEA
jgi:hypothetical protein